MPRNASGTYTLPNPPVVAGTTIDAVDENDTRDDIAQALTDSLDRNGKGGMLAPFKIYDGSVGSPGLAFLSDTDTGMYRIGADNYALVAGGAVTATVSTTSFGVLDGLLATPGLSFKDDPDNGAYRIGANNWAVVAGGVAVMELAATYVKSAVVHGFADGAVGAPGIAFKDDLDNGAYRIGANNWALAAGGTKVMDLSSNGVSLTKLADIDAKGDLLVGTADNTVARKAVSTTQGDQLVVDSAASDNWSYGQPARRRNAIINGDMSVWQRGTSFITAGSGTFAADRWFWNQSGAGVVTLSQSTDVPTVAQAGRLFKYSMDIQVTTADASIGATDIYRVGQKIEGYNWLPLAQRVFTKQIWCKAKKTGTYCVAVQNSGADRSYVAEVTINAADTWEFKTVTFTASPSAGTWDYTTGTGLIFWVTLAGGSNYQGTAGSWQSSNIVCTSNQVDAMDNIANYFRFTGVQIESGGVATEFDYRSIQDTERDCYRYCWVFNSEGTADGNSSWSGTTYAADGAMFAVGLPVRMRANPSVTYSALGDIGITSGTYGTTAGTLVWGNVTRQSGRLSSTTAGAGFGTNDAITLLANNSSCRITFSSEL